MGLKYYKNLDGVRGIAALMIVVFHFFTFSIVESYHYSWIPAVAKIAEFGQTGVSLFFVLSGFLISRILINSKEKKFFFKNFYIRRALRIFPLYYFFLLLVFYIIPLITGKGITPFEDQFYSLTYMQNFSSTFKWPHKSGPGHLWSLAVEEHFYLFWPLVIYFFNLRNTAIAIGSLIVITFLVKMVMLKNGLFIGHFTFTRIDQLAIGAFLALIEKKPFKKTKAFFVTCLCISTVMVVLVTFYLNSNFFTLKELFKYPVLAFFYFSIIGLLMSINPGNPVNRLLESKYFSYTGKISYGLYIYHPLAISLIGGVLKTGNILADFILCFLLVYAIASLSYYLLEAKFLQLKDKLTSRE